MWLFNCGVNSSNIVSLKFPGFTICSSPIICQQWNFCNVFENIICWSLNYVGFLLKHHMSHYDYQSIKPILTDKGFVWKLQSHIDH